MHEHLPTSSWIECRAEDEADVLYLTGIWRLAHVEAISGRLRELGLRARTRFVLDGSRLEALDTSAAASSCSSTWRTSAARGRW